MKKHILGWVFWQKSTDVVLGFFQKPDDHSQYSSFDSSSMEYLFESVHKMDFFQFISLPKNMGKLAVFTRSEYFRNTFQSLILVLYPKS